MGLAIYICIYITLPWCGACPRQTSQLACPLGSKDRWPNSSPKSNHPAWPSYIGLVSGGSPQTIGISRTTPGPTQCIRATVYIYMIYIHIYMQAYAMVRHLSRKYNRPGHASHTMQLIMVKILWITKRMSSPRSASQNTSSSSSSSTMVGVEPLAAADRSHARRE